VQQKLLALEQKEEARMGRIEAMMQQVLNIAMEAKVKAEEALSTSQLEAKVPASFIMFCSVCIFVFLNAHLLICCLDVVYVCDLVEKPLKYIQTADLVIH
jgi:hypothetical protein